MSSSTSSRATLTMTPSTMSPSLKYLIVSSIAPRKSSAQTMSLIAIWGVLVGRTWVEVMYSIAPDGGCVGTGSPAAGVTADGGESRRALSHLRTAHADLWRHSMVRTWAVPGPPGSQPLAGTGG